MEASILWHTGPLIDEHEIAEVHALVADAEGADGVAPLSEQPLLNLRAAGDDVVHLLTWQGGEMAGYAQVDTRSDPPSAELVIRPSRRRRGLGFHLLASATSRAAETAAPQTTTQKTTTPETAAATPPSPLRVWAHGDLPVARALAAKAGLVVVRELLLLGRPLDRALGAPAEQPLPEVPAGLRLRAFRPGHDDDAWLALNARAFATHPEQGRLTPADLGARMAENWFDADGFLLLERDDGSLAGFVWTKIPTGQPARSREGEIYVLGVDPDAQGEGLGRLLTGVGLAHLARAGADRAVLYVDGENAAAVRTYEGAGFTRLKVDVQYG